MKRIFAAVLAAVLCLGLSGCHLFDGFRYMDAMELYEAGSYEEAMTAFTELADYADSQAMVQICRQKIDYAQAEALYAAGEYAAAMEIYTALGMYEDSPIKVIYCQYDLAQQYLAAGDYPAAYEWYTILGNYGDSLEKIEQLRWPWLWDHLSKSGPVQCNPEENSTLSLSALEDGNLLLTYSAEGALLGLPYFDELKITFGPYGADASYEARCVSEAASTITEEATGPLHTGNFLPGQSVSMDLFRQTITVTYADGTEPPEPVVTEDPEQMLLIKGLFNTAQTAVQAHLAELVAETGVPITVRDLGFVISE